jgi:hypothetical protein
MKGDDTTYLSDGEYRNRCALFRLFFYALNKILAGFQCTNLKSTGIYYGTLRARPE